MTCTPKSKSFATSLEYLHISQPSRSYLFCRLFEGMILSVDNNREVIFKFTIRYR